MCPRRAAPPGPPPGLARWRSAGGGLNPRRVFEQKSPLDLSFFYKLDSRIEKDGHAEMFYSPARPRPPPLHDRPTEEVKNTHHPPE